MGQGQDKIARSLLDIEPTAVLEFFLLYYNYADDQNSFFAFHGGSVSQQPVKWQGIEYLPLPVETEGFETNANGRIARPKIKISNKDYIISDFLKTYKDLQFARLIRKRTFLKFIDDDNFAGGNPWGQSDANAELSNDTYIISQKTSENKIFVEFELTSPLDMENININNRLILSRYCGFTYRGDGCFYNRIPVADFNNSLLSINTTQRTAFNNGDPNFNFEWQNGKNYVVGDIAYIENKNIIIDYFKDAVYSDRQTFNYLKSFYVVIKNHTATLDNAPFGPNAEANWKKDECSKTVNGCKLRFSTNSWLPFGGFPSTENFSYGQR